MRTPRYFEPADDGEVEDDEEEELPLVRTPLVGTPTGTCRHQGWRDRVVWRDVLVQEPKTGGNPS